MWKHWKATVLLIAIVSFRCGTCDGGSHLDWEYLETGDHQFSKWPGECNHGQAQSPINIEKHMTVEENSFSWFIFHGYDHPGKGLEVLNNGRTIKFQFTPGHEGKAEISGGGLPGSKFHFVQGHFHWGSRDDLGSEHTIDGVHAPMELHLVHFNTDKGQSLAEAIQSHSYNTLAVLGVPFYISKKANEKIDSLVQVIRNITEEDENVIIPTLLLDDLLPRNVDRFFRYNGSLTTPGCGEVVVWTYFQEGIPISEEQMEVFRTVHYGEGRHNVSNNFRPVRPLNGRKVLDVNTGPKAFKSSSGLLSTTIYLIAASIMFSFLRGNHSTMLLMK